MASSILEIIFRGRDAGASAAASGLQKSIGGLNQVLGAFGLAIGTKELFDFGKASVEAAREAMAAEAELAAVLESSGQATKGYKEELQALATELQNTSNFTDEAVMHAQSILLTFDRIGQETMPRATQAVADLAQLMGGDLQGASLQVGKALQGQLSALERSGVSFTESEKAKAEALFATGQAAEAQTIILAALERQVGGQAAAAREAAGGWQDTAVAMGDFQEEFGKLILALGNTGAGDAAVTVLDKLAAGAKAWTFTISEALPAISEFMAAQENLNPIIAGSVQHQEAQRTALEETAAAQEEAAAATSAAAAAAEDELAVLGPLNSSLIASGHSARGAGAGEQALARGLLAAAAAAREKKRALEEGLVTQREAANQGQLDLRAQKEAAPELGARITEQRQKVFEVKQKQEEEAARDSERTMRESNAAIADSVSELGNQISSAVSGAITGVNQDVIGKLLGIEGAEANAGEAVRRMAAVAAGGIQNEWAPALAAQLTGVQDQTAQAFVQAFQAGDSGALQAAAGQLALNPIVELFDANLIAQQVEQKLRAQQLTQQLNDKVNALLGEKGLPAVAAVSQQVGQAATDTGVATGQVTQGTAEMAASAEVAAAQVQAAFTAALPAVNLLITRLEYMIGIIVRVGVVSQAAAGSVAGLNPPSAPSAPGAAAVPNGAMWKIGGVGMIE